MRNPNGYGSVTKLSGKRRKPYWVKKTIGWKDNGQPIYQTIGYARTRAEGNIMLAEFNKNPWDVDARKITLEELYNKWVENKTPLLGAGNAANLKSKWQYIKHLGSTPYNQLKSSHMQEAVNGCPSASTKNMTRNLWKHLDSYAFELDIIEKQYSTILKGETSADADREPFSPEEIHRLFTLDDEIARLALVYIYTGMRANELLSVPLEQIHIEERYIIAGSKTAAGKNRYIPIHPVIMNIVAGYLDRGYISNTEYHSLNARWKRYMKEKGFNKVMHECRHTFETEMDKAGADRKCIDLIIGHKGQDIGNRVYNHRTYEELQKAILLFPDYSLLVTQ